MKVLNSVRPKNPSRRGTTFFSCGLMKPNEVRGGGGWGVVEGGGGGRQTADRPAAAKEFIELAPHYVMC